MSALAIPLPAPRRAVPARTRRAAPADTAPADTAATRRGHLELVGPGHVPAAAPASAPATETAGQPLRLTARGRLVRSVAVLLLGLTAAVAAGGWLGSVAAQAPYEGPTTTVTVTSGQTLWGIAAASAGTGQDVRDVVDVIRDLNTLPTADLAVGQRLVVPAG